MPQNWCLGTVACFPVYESYRVRPILIIKAPRSAGLVNIPKNFMGAFKKPDRRLNIGMVVGSGLT